MAGFDVIAAEGNAMRTVEIAALFRVAPHQVKEAANACSMPNSLECYSVSEVSKIREQLEIMGVPVESNANQDHSTQLSNFNHLIRLKVKGQ